MRAAEAATPLADGELEALFAPLAGASRLALAVSGGADSLALLDAVDRWRKHDDRPGAIVLTVDHRLRPGSGDEAEGVLAVAAARGLPARTLVRLGEPPASDIEAAARDARYRLLLGAAREAGASHLLVAHHRDDQAETFLMRLERRSGLFGLAAMRRKVRAGDITIFRPFLDVPKSRLVATTAAAGLVPADDPMNADRHYLRARLRHLMPLLEAEGIGPAVLAGVAAELAAVADAIEAAADRLLREAVAVDALAVARLDPDRFAAAPEAVRARVLVRLAMAVGGEPYPPRGERLGALHRAMIAAGATGGFKRTLAGVVVERRGGAFVVYREIGRAGLPVVPVGPGHAGIYDHRFRIAVGDDAPAGLSLAALGEAGRRETGLRPARTPPAAVAALPALWVDGAPVAVPSLGWWAAGHRFTVAAAPILAGRLAEPSRFPDLAADDRFPFTLP